MRSKKLLTLLLVVCMVIGCMTPVSAVMSTNTKADVDNITSVADANKDNTNTPVVGLNVKDDPSYLLSNSEKQQNSVINGTASAGHWNAEVTEGSSIISKVSPTLPSSIQDIQEYGKSGKATVFIVLEEKPLVEYYSSILDVPATEISKLEQHQNYVLSVIQEDVLDGMAPEVVGQFNYLTNAIAIDIEIAKIPELAAIEGVESVFVSPVFYACETTMNPSTVTSGQMSGVDTVWNTEELGYTDASYFIKVFKRYAGTTPLSFRRRGVRMSTGNNSLF